MAFKLKKTELDTLLKLASNMRAAEETLEQALIDYNLKLSEAKEFVEKVAEDWRAEFDDKSEEWQAGERGDEANEIIEDYEGFLQEYDDLDVDTPGAADALDALVM